MLDKSKLTDIERDLVEGLEGFVKDLKSNKRIPDKYTCRRMVLDLHPQRYTATQVKSTRKLLQVSQALFAQFLGVSPQTVRSWEQGKTPPKDIACRFMDEIRRNPEYWRQRIAESAKMRPCKT
ncbi:MAG: helix-turn-helix domain-containing protein [Pirellulales bacterium]